MPCGDEGGLGEGVTHRVMGHVVIHPVRLDHFIGVEEIAADKRGEHGGAGEARHGRFRLHEGRVRGEAGNPQPVAVTDFLHQQRILLH